jgi:cell division protein FtsQ
VVHVLQEEQKVPMLPNPQKRSRTSRKLLAFLFVFFIIVLIILFFQSSLSRISEIQIEGNEMVTSDIIGQAAAIHHGDRFFTISGNAIEDRIKSLKMVQSAEVKKHFPGIVHIQIKEYPKVAFQITEEGKKQAVLADGSLIDLLGANVPLDRPILTGWSETDPNKLALVRVLGDIPAGTLSDLSEIKPDPSNAYPDKIKIYTRSQFEVYTTIAYLPDKIDNLPAYIASLKESNKTSGIINMLEIDNHAPFETSIGANEEPKSVNKPMPSPSNVPESKKSDAKDSKPTPTPKTTSKPVPKDTVKPS